MTLPQSFSDVSCSVCGASGTAFSMAPADYAASHKELTVNLPHRLVALPALFLLTVGVAACGSDAEQQPVTTEVMTESTDAMMTDTTDAMMTDTTDAMMTDTTDAMMTDTTGG